MRQEKASQSKKTLRNDLERQGRILSDQQERYDACRGHEITPFLSVDFPVFRSRLSPSRRHPTTMLPASFAPNTESSLASGMEGLRHNFATIRSTPPPPSAGSSLGRASVLVQDMGEGLSLKFTGQASDKWSVCLSRLLVFFNARGLQGGFGGTPLPWYPRIPWR